VSTFDVTVRSAGLRRRRIVQNVFAVIATLSAAAAVAMLCIVLGSVIAKGAASLSVEFFTEPRGLFGEPGGIADAIIGSCLIVAIATLIAVPMGVLVAIYVAEFANKSIGTFVRVVLDVMNGIPAIVVGIFVFGLLVVGSGQSGLKGAFALACLMLPLVARATMEVLALVPSSLREASLALGIARWRTTLSIVLPQTIGGILTGTVLAVARVAGETAPLLFTSSIVGTKTDWNPFHALQSVPVAIFELSDSPDPLDHQRAWAAALVLLLFILFTSLGARWLAARSRRKLTASR